MLCIAFLGMGSIGILARREKLVTVVSRWRGRILLVLLRLVVLCWLRLLWLYVVVVVVLCWLCWLCLVVVVVMIEG